MLMFPRTYSEVSTLMPSKIRDFVKEVQNELLKPGFNFFGLSDCKAPKVLGDIVESIAGAIFLDSGHEISVVWKTNFETSLSPGIAQNPQKKMAKKLAARNALAALKEKEMAEAKEDDNENGKKKKNGSQTLTRQMLNDICLRRNWPMPFYRLVNEGGPAHAKQYTYAVHANTPDRGWTDECVGDPMPSVKKAKDSAVLLLELINRL
ncbi:hypothetical protein SO802_016212 [Lithocarpus litseifolius]|uniref:RNase III domain-containing protein n=1 Tax=Lithocarpus litseifolius TaxID=425828 RepID=A0AAW2CZI2_9ROSI